jgi:hypothetical protein
MTNLEAIKAQVIYPLPDNSFKKVLTDRGLTDSDTYSSDNYKAFELATADALHILITAPNISEGGYSISLTEKKELKEIASGLYEKHGVSNPFKSVISSIKVW